MNKAALNVDGATAHLSGDLTFATVTALFARMESIARTGEMPSAIDLSSVEQIDSAGLALLLEWQSMFMKRQGEHESALIRIDNPPQALLKIARLCDAEDYLANGTSEASKGGAE